SPCDHSRIFSGLASEIRIAEKLSGSLGFSKNEKISRMVFHLSAWGTQGQSSAAAAADVSTSSTLRHNDCNSLINTLKLSGRPASSAYSPLTMDSYMRVRP